MESHDILYVETEKRDIHSEYAAKGCHTRGLFRTHIVDPQDMPVILGRRSESKKASISRTVAMETGR